MDRSAWAGLDGQALPTREAARGPGRGRGKGGLLPREGRDTATPAALGAQTRRGAGHVAGANSFRQTSERAHRERLEEVVSVKVLERLADHPEWVPEKENQR